MKNDNNRGKNLIIVEGKSCPECGYAIVKDTAKCEEYCLRCGLVVDAPYNYVAGFKIELPEE